MEKLRIEELVMEITRICNLDCRHCFRGNSQSLSMETHTINNLFKNIGEIDKLVLSGGEPLIAIRQLNDVADSIRRNCVKVDTITIITNGTVLNPDIMMALEKLQMVCKNFHVRVSDDKFHRISLDKSGLKNRRNVNFALLNAMFGATLYGTPRKEAVISLIESVGRARTITDAEMQKINEYGDYYTYYTLTTSEMFGDSDLTVHYNPPYFASDNVVKEIVNIDVNGYLADGYASYKDSDEHNIIECNINSVSLADAISNNTSRIENAKQKRL